MDFVVGLPWSNGCDAIWVVVDRLTKQRHLVPCTSTVDAKDLADLFIQWGPQKSGFCCLPGFTGACGFPVIRLIIWV